MNNPNDLHLERHPDAIPIGDPRIVEIFIEGLKRIMPDILRDIQEQQQQTQPTTSESIPAKVR